MQKRRLTTILLAIMVTLVLAAIVQSRKSYALMPEWRNAVSKGIEEYETGLYKESVETLKRVIKIIPKEEKDDLWDAHFYLGMSYYLLNETEKTIEEFGKASMAKEKLPDFVMHSPKMIKMYQIAAEALKKAEERKRKKRELEEKKRKYVKQGLVYVKGGCYQMGDTFGGGDSDEKPVHEVCVDDFYMGEHEVTQGEWKKIMGNNPSRFSSCGADCPVEKVSWNDVQKYIKKLNKKTGAVYKLPTEAEWEYAARSGGKEEKWSGTSSRSNVGDYAWYVYNSGSKTHPVKTKKPNSLGLYDMSGNVWEWVSDWYGKNYYRTSRKDNPEGPSSGSNRVIRGGSWYFNPWILRVAYRYRSTPDGRNDDFGFRLARTK